MGVNGVLRAVAVLGVAAGFARGSQAGGQQSASVTFSVVKATDVPGGVLKPGEYSIEVVDKLRDRMVVRVDGNGGKTHFVFLAIPQGASAATGAHAVEWNAGGADRHALRGFVFGTGQTVEFVYPKSEAVALAKANDASVVAVDPASEGRPELSKLTSLDQQEVSLWMLTPTRVAPGASGQKGIEAKHYVAQDAGAPVVAGGGAPMAAAAGGSVATAATASGRVTAAGTVNPSAVASQHASPVQSGTVSNRQVAGTQVAQMQSPRVAPVRTYRPAVKRLPQTGSELPAVWLLGGFSFVAAAAARVRRKRLS